MTYIHNYICIVGCPDFHPALSAKQWGKIETEKKNHRNVLQIMTEYGPLEQPDFRTQQLIHVTLYFLTDKGAIARQN